MAWLGLAGQASRGLAWLGMAWRGTAWQGTAGEEAKDSRWLSDK